MHIHFAALGKTAKLHYEIEARGGEVTVRGTSGVAMCRGAYDYLRTVGAAQATWGGTTLNVPKKLPDLRKSVDCPYKWVLQDNVCVFGYTTAFYGWKEWQHYLDVMALHGINMQFAPVGGEAVWSKVWKSFGMTQKDVDGFFTGPAFLPWHRMGNVNGHDGPLPATYLTKSITLQKKILGQMRALGIQPVAPGFAGFVPGGFAKKYPDQNVLHVASWAGFEDPYRTWILHPLSKMYSQIGGRYIKEWKKTFGDTHYFLADSFNELEVPVSEDHDKRMEELALFGKSVYDGIRAGDPQGTWVMQGWLFFNARSFWTKPAVQALLSRVPNDKMMILDLFAEASPIWKLQDAFYGKQWILSNITTWGGNNQPYGNFEAYRKLSSETLTAPNHGNLVGYGISFEGSESNEAQFELLCDTAWRTDTIPLSGLIQNDCVENRYGKTSAEATEAWSDFAKSAYSMGFGIHPNHALQERPHSFNVIGSPDRQIGQANDSPEFRRGVDSLVRAKSLGKDPLYRADVDQFVAHRVLAAADRMLRDAVVAQDEGMTDVSIAREKLFVQLALGADDLLATHPIDRLERWVGQARAWGDTVAQKNYFESDAKRQVTVWGGPALSEYAAKMWSGLIRNYYVPRWTKWLDARREGKKFDVQAWEEKWITTPGQYSGHRSATSASYLLDKVRALPDSDFVKASAGKPVGEWKSGEQSPIYIQREWDVTSFVSKPGNVVIRFQYTNGACRLDVDGVELLADGVVVAVDKHFGRTGLEDVDNLFRFKVAGGGTKYVVRARVRSDGGNDSNGTIFARYSKK